MKSPQCWSTGCRRVVRSEGEIHCQRCHDMKKALMRWIRGLSGKRRGLTIAWTLMFGTFNRREVDRLFP